MKKAYLAAAFMLTLVLGVGVSAHAQDTDAVAVKVPFEFVAGGATLPAGQYRVSRINPGINRELSISSYDKGTAFLAPLAFDGEGVPANQPTLSFERVGGKYFLTQIKTTGGVYTIATSRQMILLGQNAPSSGTSTASGSH